MWILNGFPPPFRFPLHGMEKEIINLWQSTTKKNNGEDYFARHDPPKSSHLAQSLPSGYDIASFAASSSRRTFGGERERRRTQQEEERREAGQ